MSSSGDTELEAKAREFADNLTQTFRGIQEDAPSFSSSLRGNHLWVTSVGDDGTQEPVIFKINEEPRIRVDAEFYVYWDTDQRFLAVNKSKISCSFKERRPEPLFRYEYERDWTSPPSAHLHIHAHRDEAAFLLRLADRDRPKHKTKTGVVPRLKEIHFPVGGHRYRPCVEEVLWLLVEEFGVDRQEGWKGVLAEGIFRWREIQLRSAVRDNAEVAAAALGQLGYTVIPPDEGHRPRGTKFTGR